MGKVNVPHFVDGYAPPSPPKWVKRDRFNIKDVKELDEQAKQVKVTSTTTFDELASELTSGLKTDLQKVRALFTWMGNQDIKGRSYPDVTDDHTPEGYMKLVQTNYGDYHQFFALLCRAADLPCVILWGRCKSVDYEVGDQDVGSHIVSWNAVFVDGSWQIVHPYWAFRAVSGYDNGKWIKIQSDNKVTMEKPTAYEGVHISHVCEDYFLPHPDEFVYGCIAEKKEWQLLEEPWDLKKFCNVPKFRQAYFTSHYKLTSRHKAILTSIDGKCEVEFTEKDEAPSCLTYSLFFDAKQSPDKLPSKLELPRTVFFETNGNKLRLFVRFHMVGIYKLSVGQFAEFRLEAKEKSENENLLPVNPPIGFGFGRTATERGIKDPSHTGGVVVTPRNTAKVFKFRMVRSTEIVVRLRHVTKETYTLQKYIEKTIEGNMVIIRVTMPNDSACEEYALQIYTGEEQNILNYLLTCKQEDFDFQTEPELLQFVDRRMEFLPATTIQSFKLQSASENLKNKLRIAAIKEYEEAGIEAKRKRFRDEETEKLRCSLIRAIENRDLEALERAIIQCEEIGLHGDDDLIRGRQLLVQLYEEGLTNTMRSNIVVEVKRLEKKANASPVAQEISDSAVMLKVKRFIRIHKYHSVVLDVKPATVSEIHRCATPHPAIFQAVVATYIILGQDMNSLQEWNSVRNLLRSIKGGLRSRIKTFRFDDLDEKTALEAKMRLDKYTLDDVRLVSAGAAAFHAWSSNIVTEHLSSL